MPYSHTTYAQFRTALANQLGDPNNLYWSDAELGYYTLETLRTWQSLSAFWRQRGVVTALGSTVWIDLPSQLPSLLGYTVKDTDLISTMQFHLLEPLSPAVWIGSEMFTLPQITNTLQRMRDTFLEETGCVLTQATSGSTAPTNGIMALADNVIDVRRLAWLASGGFSLYGVGGYGAGLYSFLQFSQATPLWCADEWSALSYQPGWNLTSGTPTTYSTVCLSPLQIQLIPVPLSSGNLDMVTVNTGAILNPTAGGTLLGIPDSYSWIIKWGALGDLLSQDGEARDDARAAYCDARWREGVELARSPVSILQARINEQQVPVNSVASLDAYNPQWQVNSGTPTDIGVMGWNLLALSAPPVSTVSVTLDVASNAVLPVADSDFLQVGREDLDPLLDYAQHLASFKMGGRDFLDTDSLRQHLITHAALYSDRLKGMSIYLNIFKSQANNEKKKRTRRASDAVEEAAA